MTKKVLTKDGLIAYDQEIKNYIKNSIVATSTSFELKDSCDGTLRINYIYGNTTQDGTSGKNFLDCSNLTEQTINGVTFTPVYDNNGLLEYINVNGTATANAVFYFPFSKLEVGKTYIHSGCPSGGSTTKYYCQIANWGNDFGSGSNTTATDTTGTNYSIIIVGGYTASNLKFYPMIRLASITDGTYEPFTDGASPNPSYPQEIKRVVLSKINSFMKNLLDCSRLKEQIINGVTFTPVYDDNGLLQYINVNGTATDNTAFIIDSTTWVSSTMNYKNGKYVLSGCPIGGSVTGYRLQFWNYKGDSSFAYDVGYGQDFDFSNEGGNYNIAINVYSGTVCNNLKFYPMIRLASITDGTYEPFTKSVAQLSKSIVLNGRNGVCDFVNVKRGVSVHKFEEVTFNGNETWYSSDNTSFSSEISRFYTLPTNFKAGAEILCDSFIVGDLNNNSTRAMQNICSHPTAQNVNIFIKKSLLAGDTVGDFTAWLASNPIKVVYELDEPIETPLSDEDIKSLKSLKTFDGITYVDSDSEVHEVIEVEYATSKVGADFLEIYNKSSLNSSGVNEIISSTEPTGQSVGENWLLDY